MFRFFFLFATLFLGSVPAWAALALDGSAHGNSNNALTATATLTTTHSGDVIIVVVQANSAPLTGVSGASLGAFTHRTSEGGSQDIEEWYAIASGALTSEVITATQSASNFLTIDAFGISGANTSSPYDGTAVVGASDPLHISTTHANTFIFGGFKMNSTASPTAGAGWTGLSGANYQLSEYQIVSSTQTSLAVSLTTGAGDIQAGLADAVVQASAGGSTPAGLLPMMGVGQ
jgi:hypothetical protein